MNKCLSIIFIILLTFLSACSSTTTANQVQVDENSHIVVDSMEREVVVPREVKRIAATYAASGHILALLGKAEQIVAVNGGQKRDKLLTTIFPSIKDAAVPKESGKMNFEELAKVNPDIILINAETYYDEGQMNKLEKLKIPYFVIEYNTIEEQKQTIREIGKIVKEEEKTQQYLQYYEEKMNLVSERISNISEEEKVRVYHSINEATRTNVPGTLSFELLEKVGAANVAADEDLRMVDNKYFASVEQILLWNPDVILVNEDGVEEYIKTKPQWKNINAVKNDKVYLLPNGLTRWGHPDSIETPIAALYVAQLLYPEYFQDINMKEETRNYYNTFFPIELTVEQVDDILSGKEMRIPKGEVKMLKCLICIDDTDNLESLGTGEHADEIAIAIKRNGWGETSRVTRHQLYVHEDIPYTSHNSSMCFEAYIREEYLENVIDFSINYLKENHAPGSDPGLCIVNLSLFHADDDLIQFGKMAKKQVLTKQDAYEFAKKHHIHLSEHGGTGLGVIGALAGCGLRLSGNDGRFRGKRTFSQEVMSIKELCQDPNIDTVQSVDGEVLSFEQIIDVRGNVKTVLLDHQSVLLVTKTDDTSDVHWKMIPKEKLKNY